MAGAAGLEPATLGFGDRCSTKLSYAPANLFELDRQAELRFCQCLSDLGGYPALECVPYNLIQFHLNRWINYYRTFYCTTIKPVLYMHISEAFRRMEYQLLHLLDCLSARCCVHFMRSNCNSWLARLTSDGLSLAARLTSLDTRWYVVSHHSCVCSSAIRASESSSSPSHW